MVSQGMILKKHRYKLAALLLLLLLVLGFWQFRDQGDEIYQWVELVRLQLELLPTPLFFVTLGLLPLVGVPIVPLYILAGAVYGVWVGLLGMGVSLLLNFSLSYWIGFRFLRSPVHRMVQRAGWTPPEQAPAYPVRFTLLVRFAPGAPLLLQNYFLTLARIPFRTFLIVSWLAEMLIASGYILTGKSLLTGQWGYLVAGLVLVVLILAVAKTYYRKVISREKALKVPVQGDGDAGSQENE